MGIVYDKALVTGNAIKAFQKNIKDQEDKTLAVACAALFEPWKPGEYNAGDIRTKDGTPYECITGHDSTINIDWTIDVRSLWKPYHSRKQEYALPFVQPTGAHDMYKVGEYVIYNENVYLCKSDTAYSPDDYPAAWE